MEEKLPTLKEIMAAIKKVDDAMLYDIAALVRREILKRNEVKPTRSRAAIVHAD